MWNSHCKCQTENLVIIWLWSYAREEGFLRKCPAALATNVLWFIQKFIEAMVAMNIIPILLNSIFCWTSAFANKWCQPSLAAPSPVAFYQKINYRNHIHNWIDLLIYKTQNFSLNTLINLDPSICVNFHEISSWSKTYNIWLFVELLLWR